MHNILTADQFLNSVLAMLHRHYRLSQVEATLEDANLDYRFEKAFEALLDKEEELKVTPNFTFFRDPLHGDSVKLRNALLVARENGLLEQEGRFKYRVKMDKGREKDLLRQSHLPDKFLEDVINDCFSPRRKTSVQS